VFLNEFCYHDNKAIVVKKLFKKMKTTRSVTKSVSVRVSVLMSTRVGQIVTAAQNCDLACTDLQ